MTLGFALRGIFREARGARGRLLFFVLCLAVGVAGVVGVRSLVFALEYGIRAQSRDLLAADVSVESSRPIGDGVDTVLADRDFERADLMETAFLVRGGSGDDGRPRSRLVELGVVRGRYPLYGRMVLEPDRPLEELLDGGVVVGPELLHDLGVGIGDEIAIGAARFEIRGVVHEEPARMEFSALVGPRVFLGPLGFVRARLTMLGNRVRHRALLRFSGEPGPSELTAIKDDLERGLEDAAFLEIESHDEAQPTVRRGLDNIERFLGLVALLSLLLGGLGVAQVVGAWVAQRTQSIAVYRCLGFRPREVMVLYLGQVLLLAVAACAVGAAAGGALPYLLPKLAPEIVSPEHVVVWPAVPMAWGFLLGGAVATIFSLLPLTAVWRIAPARVLRADAEPLPPPRLVRVAAAIALVAGVLGCAWLQSGRPEVAGVFTAGIFVTVMVLWVVARVAVIFVGRLPRGRVGPYLRHGLAALARPGAGTVGAVVALGLGVGVIVTVVLVQTRMREGLFEIVPEDAPTTFFADVPPAQWADVETVIAAHGGVGIDSVPVARARVVAIGGRSTAELAEEREGDRDRWALTREQRLTWATELPRGNTLAEGELWGDDAVAEVSLEQEFAENLQVGLGDVLTVDVGGTTFDVTVTSLREIDWQSFAINFFVLVEPGVVDGVDHYRIAAAHVEEAREQPLQDALAAAHPGVTMLRVRQFVERVVELMWRLGLAVRVLGSLTVVAGLAILAGAISAQTLRRTREAALLKVIGATRGGVALLFAVEYGLVGGLAGLVGASAGCALAWAFLEYVVELEAALPWSTIPLATVIGALATAACGLATSARALAARPIEALRG